MICFLGHSHAPRILRAAAEQRGLRVTNDILDADLVFVSQDTPTNEYGERDLEQIREMVTYALQATHDIPIVLTSQVTPGFTRSFQDERLIHMAETLRIKDAMQRALFPEQFIIGLPSDDWKYVPSVLRNYCNAHHEAKLLLMSYEDAEFAKIAINRFLAAQVETTNELAMAAEQAGADWNRVKRALQNDRRIGPYAYLEPGRWQESPHLLRDFVTLRGLCFPPIT